MTETIALLSHYSYLILFPLSIFEGPIITVIAAFLTTMGLMNVLIVYAVVLLGDVTGDTFLYYVGRTGGKGLMRVRKFFRVTPEKLEQAKIFFDTHHHKALVLSKVFHGVGVAGLLSAGILKISYRRYASVCFLISAVQSAILVVLGVVFGHLYVQIGKYLDIFAATMSVIAIVGIVVFILYKTKNLSILGK